MIHEVDEVLKRLLTGGALAGSGVEIAFEAPTRDWAARRNAPTVDCYLYDIREDTHRRERGHVSVRNEQGVTVRRRQPPRWFRLSYLVTAWTKQPQDEHRMLSAVLATLLPHELLPPERLAGSLAALGLTVPLSVAALHMEARSTAEIWSALGGELKPSIDVVVTVPMLSYPEYDAGPPVTELGVRVRGIEGDLEDSPDRHFPARHLAGAGHEGGDQGGSGPAAVPGPRTRKPGSGRPSGAVSE
ncbi:DUF4255 domain-containing protein [Streptacidiphilus sp. MAP5-3]|uniref:DUF4255 domain-containing protein n=1 Tax=unclassified Streptacidiphilus TaxID=2643834 RepID=UPI00351435E4